MVMGKLMNNDHVASTEGKGKISKEQRVQTEPKPWLYIKLLDSKYVHLSMDNKCRKVDRNFICRLSK